MQITPRLDWALFLDIDGTLIDHADHPEGVTIPEDLPALLIGLQQQLQGAAALVSGRTIEWMDRRFSPARLAAAGQHGAEIRLSPDEPSMPLAIPPWRRELELGLEAALADWPGVFVEDKPLSLAVHYRAVPQFTDAVHIKVGELARSLGPEVEILSGRGVIEIRQRGLDKGTAVDAFLQLPVFAGRRPVFLGDDVTDEDGFRRVRAAGGLAVAVGPRATTQADLHLAKPADVRAWLGSLLPDCPMPDTAPATAPATTETTAR